MIDICLNFASEQFDKDRDEIIKRALDNGVDGFIFTGTSLKSSKIVHGLVKKYPNISCSTAGVHPHDAKSWKTSKETIKNLAKESNVVAIGECGLDYDRMFSTRDEQMLAFKEQLDIALDNNKPVFIHIRPKIGEGEIKLIMDDFISIYKPYHDKGVRGVVHCFTGNKKMLDAFISYDLFIGITGWVCDDKRGEQLQKLIKYIPENRLMIETDAPYLTPRNMPKDLFKRRNEPAFLKFVIAKIAEIKNVKVEDLIIKTNSNVKELFNWNPMDDKINNK